MDLTGYAGMLNRGSLSTSSRLKAAGPQTAHCGHSRDDNAAPRHSAKRPNRFPAASARSEGFTKAFKRSPAARTQLSKVSRELYSPARNRLKAAAA